MNNAWKSHLALFGANLIYGVNYSVAKIALPEYLKPYGFIFTRVVVAMLLYVTLHTLVVRERIQKADVPRLILCGIFGVAVNQTFFFKGLSITTEVNASLLMITTPILVLVISAIFIKERITTFKLVGILMGAAGAFLIIRGKGPFDFTSDTVLGDVFVMINAASYAIYLVIVKPLMKKYNPITVIRWVFTFGFIPVFFVGFQQFTEVGWSELPTKAWVSVGYVVLFTTVGAYLLNIFALKRVQPSVVGIYIYLQPVLAALTAWVFSLTLKGWPDASLQTYHAVAAVLIFTGVFLVNRKPRQPKALA